MSRCVSGLCVAVLFVSIAAADEVEKQFNEAEASYKREDRATARRMYEELYELCVKEKRWEQALRAVDGAMRGGSAAHRREWIDKAIDVAEQGKLAERMGPLLGHLGHVYTELNLADEALEAWTRAREYVWKHGTESEKLMADWSVGYGQRVSGNMEAAKQWQRPVLAWAERRLAEKADDDRRQHVALAKLELGRIALHEVQKKRASVLLHDAQTALAGTQLSKFHPDWWKAIDQARVEAQTEEQKLAAAREDLHILFGAVQAFLVGHKKLPKNLSDLTQVPQWRRSAYLTKVALDPWGNAYVYKITKSPRYEVRSGGPDKKPGTKDDLVYPVRK